MKNCADLFHDGTFLMALRNNIIMVVGSLIAHMPLAMLFANAVFKKIRGATFFQTVFFLPCVIRGVAVGLTNFKSQYSTNYVGMIAAVILTIIPSIAVYAVLHKQIMEGMVAGTVKG